MVNSLEHGSSKNNLPLMIALYNETDPAVAKQLEEKRRATEQQSAVLFLG